MGKIIDALYRPMTVTRNNIDPRYFKDNGDGNYKLTQLMIYNIARDAAEYFKQRIFDIDTDCQYHSASVREVKDTFTEKALRDQWRLKYGEQLKEAKKRWYEYRDEHPDEFELGARRIATGGEDENRYFDSYTPFITPNLVSTIQTYNAARELLARFDSENGTEYGTLPFEEPLYSREKFANVHKAVKATIYSELGIPTNNLEVGKVEKVVCRINNKKCDVIAADDAEIEGFYKGLIVYITGSNAAEYAQRRYEELT